MFAVEKVSGTKAEIYKELVRQTRGLLHGERDLVANAANVAALIWQFVPDLNWAGFYFLKGDELVLGPFQGKPACVRIAVGKGVCGTAAARRETVLVEDVHAFPGHIACDSASNSELVVPLVKDGEVRGVLDLDSSLFSRFDAEDRRAFEALVVAFVEGTDF
ncbi:MAG: GAF domain-containing protein [Alphaproteobacteria bacterium]|nr:GAF domain-containing protein [Alphaproteobacteria bacterium]